MAELIGQAGLHAMGSLTFKDMAAYWPTSTEPFAPPMNEIPKVVFSRRGLDAATTTRGLEDASPTRLAPAAPAKLQSWKDARVLDGELAEEIAALKREPGKPILAHGGASFARSLIERGLVDEYWLLTHPVVIGRGLPVFTDVAGQRKLVLVASRSFPGGIVANQYRAT